MMQEDERRSQSQSVQEANLFETSAPALAQVPAGALEAGCCAADGAGTTLALLDWLT